MIALINDSRKLFDISLIKCQLRQDRVYFKDQLMISDDDALQLQFIQLSHDTFIMKHLSEIKIYEILS